MALPEETVWEMRVTGSNTNGGGFYDDGVGDTTDYSQQVAAELALTDIATDGAGTTITSVTGGFTSVMKNNLINLAGDWYWLTAITDTNTATIDRSAGASLSGLTGNVGGAVTVITDALSEVMHNGAGKRICHVASGTYISTENVYTGTAGTLWFVGYKTSRNDEPTGDDRPLINFGVYQIRDPSVGGTSMQYLRTTGTHGDPYRVGKHTSIVGSRFENTSASAGRYAIRLNSYSWPRGCEMISTNGYACGAEWDYCGPVDCWLHDSSYGYACSRSCSIKQCRISGITNAGVYVTGYTCDIQDNTFYDCGKCIWVNHATAMVTVGGNLFDNSTIGVTRLSVVDYEVYDYNNYNALGTDMVNASKGDHATADDPQFVNAAGDDFTLTPGSPCLKNGIPIICGVGGNTVTTHQGAVPPVAGGATVVIKRPRRVM